MGQPGWSNVQSFPYESIVRVKETRGTETSKYPEEEKEKSIPIVAASEVGRAQTRELAFWGSDCIIDSSLLTERYWKDLPENEKAVYVKVDKTRQYPE